MRSTQVLHDLGQSLWLDSISRQMFAQAGIDVDALASRLRREGAEAFVKSVKSWTKLLDRIAEKSAALAGAVRANV